MLHHKPSQFAKFEPLMVPKHYYFIKSNLLSRF
jgi:hypothetical protein